MHTFDQKFPDRDEIILATLGDWHIGAKTFDEEAAIDYVQKIKDSGAIAIVMGDLTENAIVGSASSVFEQVIPPRQQVKEAERILTPIKDQILFSIGGNHGARTMKTAGINPDEVIAYNLGHPFYGAIAAGRIKVQDANWKIMAHHGAGGGRLLGSKLNVISQKMTDIFPMADLYLAGHTHADVAGSDTRPYIDLGHGSARITRQRRHFSGTGSLLDYDGSYAENMLLPPASKVQVFHYLGRRIHKKRTGEETKVKAYRRVPHYYY